MDIFIINANNSNISDDILKEFENKTISHKNKWRKHCLSYLMLDRILKEVYKINEREVVFVNKKPILKNAEKFFSISHSGDYITLSFSDYDCGVDIERIKKVSFQDIAERMKFNCTTLEEFFYDWTKYEAEYKLNKEVQSYKQYRYDNYAITAVSENLQEVFEIYIQKDEDYSKLTD